MNSRSPPRGKPSRTVRSAIAQLRPGDLRGAVSLASQATTGVTRVVEGVHQSVLGTMGLGGRDAAGQTRGLTGMVYQGIRGVTRLMDSGLQAALLRLEPFLEREETQGTAPSPTPQRDAVLAALNGVMGDRLAEEQNPLAITMELCQNGRPLDLPALAASGRVSGKVLLLVHGLCMNDLQWQRAGHDHGTHLAHTLGYTPVYVRYNTGLHISINGRELSRQIDRLLDAWPVPVQELCIVAHSMGGLVTRAACHYGAEPPGRWLQHLRRVVFLGTPHQGAPLERAGHWMDLLLGSTPFTRPFTRLSRLRSAGITDLRYGYLLDAHWAGHDRFHRRTGRTGVLPLPPTVDCFALAGTLAARRSRVADRLLGDGLVPLQSALGIDADPARSLQFPPSHQHIAFGVGHMDLLSHAGVARQLVKWLGDQTTRD